MLRKIMAMSLALLLVLSLGSRVRAAEDVGSIHITLPPGEGEAVLYRVGIPVPEGYRLTDAYGGGFIQEEDAASQMLALWLAETETEGISRILDADGSATFTRLEAGLYLVKHKDPLADEVALPFLVRLPDGDTWDVAASPFVEPPKTGQGLGPFLGAAGMLLSGSGLLLCFMQERRKIIKRPQ